MRERGILYKIGELRMALDMVFPKLSRLPRVCPTNPVKLEDLPPEIRDIAEKMRRELAEELGLNPEDISEEYLVKWATHWLRSFVTPEAWEKLTAEYPELLTI